MAIMDPRSKVGMLSRGRNVYQGGSPTANPAGQNGTRGFYPGGGRPIVLPGQGEVTAPIQEAISALGQPTKPPTPQTPTGVNTNLFNEMYQQALAGYETQAGNVQAQGQAQLQNLQALYNLYTQRLMSELEQSLGQHVNQMANQGILHSSATGYGQGLLGQQGAQGISDLQIQAGQEAAGIQGATTQQLNQLIQQLQQQLQLGSQQLLEQAQAAAQAQAQAQQPVVLGNGEIAPAGTADFGQFPGGGRPVVGTTPPSAVPPPQAPPAPAAPSPVQPPQPPPTTTYQPGTPGQFQGTPAPPTPVGPQAPSAPTPLGGAWNPNVPGPGKSPLGSISGAPITSGNVPSIPRPINSPGTAQPYNPVTRPYSPPISRPPTVPTRPTVLPQNPGAPPRPQTGSQKPLVAGGQRPFTSPMGGALSQIAAEGRPPTPGPSRPPTPSRPVVTPQRPNAPLSNISSPTKPLGYTKPPSWSVPSPTRPVASVKPTPAPVPTRPVVPTRPASQTNYGRPTSRPTRPAPQANYSRPTPRPVSRPVSKPAPKPAPKPAARPAPRPAPSRFPSWFKRSTTRRRR